MSQLTIFDLQIQPAEPPQVKPDRPIYCHQRRDWLEGNAAFYLRLISKFVDLQIRDRKADIVNEQRRQMRSAEISRLFYLRDRCLNTIKELDKA